MSPPLPRRDSLAAGLASGAAAMLPAGMAGAQPASAARERPEFDKIVDEVYVTDPQNVPRLKELFRAAMEIWLPDLPDIQLVQNHHRIPMNTTYWKNWPTAEKPDINGASWHLTFPMVLWHLQPA